MKYRQSLTDNQICDVIKNYVQEDIYQYAIMLDGEWGAGKSFFVENRLKDMFKQDDELKDKRFIYVSLYGISSVDALKKAINNAYYKETIAKGNNNDNKLMDALMTIGLPAIECFIDFEDGETEKENEKSESTLKKKTLKAAMGLVKNTVGNLDKVKEWIVQLDRCFFVFDDLERCTMPAAEVFGYINQFIEHNKCKVLIVANEKECGSALKKDEALKLIVADTLKEHMLKDNIIKEHIDERLKNDIDLFAEEMGKYSDMLQGVEHERKISLKQIQAFSDYLFPQDELHNRTREKVIGKTIRYEADIEETTRGIVESILNEAQKEEKIIIQSSCIKTMKELKTKNFRLLQAALAGYCAFRRIVLEMEISNGIRDKIIDELMKRLLHAVVYTSESKEEQKEAQFTLTNNGSADYIKDYVRNGYINEKAAKSDFSRYVNILEAERKIKKSAYVQLKKGEHYFTEEEFLNKIEEMKREFLDNKCPPEICMDVILYSFYVKDIYDIGNPKEFCDHLKERARKEKWKNNVSYRDSGYFKELTKKCQNEYRQFNIEMQKIEEENMAASFSEALECFEGKSWSQNLLDNTRDYKMMSQMQSRYMFASCIDVDMMMQVVIEGTALDLYNLRTAFNCVYENNEWDFRKDGNALSAMIERLQELEFDDKIRERQLKLFIEKISAYRDRIEEIAREMR